MRSSMLLAAALAGLTAACGAAPAADQPLVRDSAGIVIVENPLDIDRAPAWTLEAEPALRIGVIEGEPAYQLSWVRDALRRDDGTIVVLDGAPPHVRFFRDDGRVLATTGRRGEGPGEYTSPMHLVPLPHDSLAVYDTRVGRLTVMTSHGDLARTAVPETRIRNPRVAGALDDGRIVVIERLSAPDMEMTPQELIVRVVRRDGAAADSVARMHWLVQAFMPIDEARSRFILTGPIFSPQTLVAAGGDSIIVGTADAHEVRVLDTRGRLRRIVRWQGPDLEVTTAERRAYEDRRFAESPESTPESRAYARREVEMRGYADRAAAFDDLRLDRAGRIWIRNAPRGGDDHRAPRPWLVLDDDGRVAGALTLPERFRPLDVGDGWVLGAETDELDVQYVALYRIHAAAAARP